MEEFTLEDSRLSFPFYTARELRHECTSCGAVKRRMEHLRSVVSFPCSSEEAQQHQGTNSKLRMICDFQESINAPKVIGFRDHIVSQHLRLRFPCPHCAQDFAYPRHRLRHIRRVHQPRSILTV